MKNFLILFLGCSACFFCSCKKNNTPGTTSGNQITVVKATGDIQAKVDAFRALLGPLNTTPNAKGGHREINWEGVPLSLENKTMPIDFFNPTGANAPAANQRGLVYSNQGSFMVSSDGFSGVNKNAAGQFAAFSGSKTFANTTAAAWDVTFQKAGSNVVATIQAFGLVFSDVDKDSSTALEFFDDGVSLGKFFVPAHDATSSFSFLGVQFNNGEHITKVTVTHDGFLAEGTKDVSDGGTRDLIVVDDFLYSEPVPE